MRSFEDRFFIGLLRWVLVSLSPIPILAFIPLALRSVLTG